MKNQHHLKQVLDQQVANKEMKKIKILGNPKVFISVSILILIAINLLINLISNALDYIGASILNQVSTNRSFLKMILTFNSNYKVLYLIANVVGIIFLIAFRFKIKASFKDINEGQKGTSRFTTEKEIEEQYRTIPEVESDEERANGGFEGKGGVVIARTEKRHKKLTFIDDSATNNLIIGTTRSGKGELYIFPTLDAYSRAKIKPSMIFNDPKGELYEMAKDTLKQRGYKIEVLNLLNPMESMSYNPLQLIIDAYKNGDYSTAQSLCKTLTYTLYYKPGAKDPFWQNSAMSLVNALILAIADECIANGEEEKITLYSVANMLSTLGSRETNDKNELDEYFKSLPNSSVAKMQYATSNFAKGTTRGGIFASAMAELQIFTMDEIAKMTSKNTVNFRDIGFINKEKEDNRPVAIFMIVPDYDVSNHNIASIFVRQLYYVLAKESTFSDEGKCDREVIFMLDEFGNMTAIEGIANILTVCLGRNIRFNLAVQSFSQIKKLYGDDYKTILGNCSNKFYIFTNEEETAEEFSKLLGSKTIVTYSRNGEILNSSKGITESVDGRRLLTSDELMHLKEGEIVIVRGTKRRDLKNNKIRPYPIINNGENMLKYRYEYLTKYFPNRNAEMKEKIEALHKDIQLHDLLVFDEVEEIMIDEQTGEVICNAITGEPLKAKVIAKTFKKKEEPEVKTDSYNEETTDKLEPEKTFKEIFEEEEFNSILRKANKCLPESLNINIDSTKKDLENELAKLPEDKRGEVENLFFCEV